MPKVCSLQRHSLNPANHSPGTDGSTTSLRHLTWPAGRHPQNVFLVKKPWQPHVRQAMVDFILLLSRHFPAVNVIVEPDVAEEIEPDLTGAGKDPGGDSPAHVTLYTTTVDANVRRIFHKSDLLVTFGGDGTILRAVSMFSGGQFVTPELRGGDIQVATAPQPVPPPVLAFSLGTLGFLMPFDVADAREVFASVLAGESLVLRRRRLRCAIYKDSARRKLRTEDGPPPRVFAAPSSPEHPHMPFHDLRSSPPEHPDESTLRLVSVTYAMNDINIHRGPDPHLTYLDITASGHYLTTCISDGVIVATPTGSTAYSLSSGGSIVHPAVACTLLTPICPRSLSFRPLVLPHDMRIEIAVSPLTRGQSTEVSIDGLNKGLLGPGDKIVIECEGCDEDKHAVDAPPSGVWCVAKSAGDWVGQLNGLLGFNTKFGVKQ